MEGSGHLNIIAFHFAIVHNYNNLYTPLYSRFLLYYRYRGGQQQERVVSVRAKRLTAVRELFIKVYSSSVPEVQEPTSGFSIAGIFSKLTSTLTTPV